MVTLTSKQPVSNVKASWDGREALFWANRADGSPAANSGAKVWRGLLGVDLEKTPGDYPLDVKGKVGDAGGQINCKVELHIRKGTFPTEKLTVEKQFVEPNPEQVKQANADRDRLRAIFASATPERLWTGSFRLPLDGVTTGGNFGRRRVLNGQTGSPHTGVDFPATTGTPVHVAQAGRVVLAEPLFFSGNTVVVDHGLGLYSFYGHLSAFAVKAGDPVAEGTVLGQAGATGRVTGPHLHWGVTLDRERVNGMDLVRAIKATSKEATK